MKDVADIPIDPALLEEEVEEEYNEEDAEGEEEEEEVEEQEEMMQDGPVYLEDQMVYDNPYEVRRHPQNEGSALIPDTVIRVRTTPPIHVIPPQQSISSSISTSICFPQSIRCSPFVRLTWYIAQKDETEERLPSLVPVRSKVAWRCRLLLTFHPLKGQRQRSCPDQREQGQG